MSKLDLMKRFQDRLLKLEDGREEFFKQLAAASWLSVRSTFEDYETVKGYGPTNWHPNIDTQNVFRKLLLSIYEERPDVIRGVVAKAFHDMLNKMPGGVQVSNARGHHWRLSGDGTLNAKTLEIGREAVAQSALNVKDAGAAGSQATLNYVEMFRKVWSYVPEPEGEGAKAVAHLSDKLTDPSNLALIGKLRFLIIQNAVLIRDKLVELKKIKKA